MGAQQKKPEDSGMKLLGEGLLSRVVNYSGFLMSYPAPGLPPARRALSAVLKTVADTWLCLLGENLAYYGWELSLEAQEDKEGCCKSDGSGREEGKGWRGEERRNPVCPAEGMLAHRLQVLMVL